MGPTKSAQGTRSPIGPVAAILLVLALLTALAVLVLYPQARLTARIEPGDVAGWMLHRLAPPKSPPLPYRRASRPTAESAEGAGQ